MSLSSFSIDDLLPQLGVFQRVMKLIRGELYSKYIIITCARYNSLPIHNPILPLQLLFIVTIILLVLGGVVDHQLNLLIYLIL